ncbi:MAG: class II glutamine amidotransferase [Acidimicrobiia bacterium]
MCRHLAHLGPPTPLHDLLFAAPHSLAHQARHPEHQEQPGVNADGWGVGWYAPGATDPERYRTVAPIWEDAAFATRSTHIESTAFLAAARLASPGAAIDTSGNAPFRSGPWLFSLNGIVHGFHDDVGRALRSQVSPARRAEIEGDTDSEVLFAMTLDRLDAGEAPVDALARVVRDVLAVTTGRINLLLTDGSLIAATRSGRSLFVRGSTVASEPLDTDPAWREVVEGGVVLVAGAHTEPIVNVAP